MIDKQPLGIATILLLSVGGCSPYPNPNPSGSVAIVDIAPAVHVGQLPEEIQKALDAQPPPEQPIRIGLALDLTGSREEHRIQPPNVDALQQLIALVREHGGEVAVMGICDDSNFPMQRLRLRAAPRLDAAQFKKVAAPVPPDEGTNSFHLADTKAAYQKQLEGYDKAQEQNHHILDAHTQALAAWESKTQDQIDTFLNQAKSLLEAEPTCPATDIEGAKQRLDVFFLEDPAAFSAPPRNFAIFISDLIDTVGRPPVSMHSDAEILLVNGSGSTGILTGTHYKLFESPVAAFDYIIATTQQGGKP